MAREINDPTETFEEELALMLQTKYWLFAQEVGCSKRETQTVSRYWLIWRQNRLVPCARSIIEAQELEMRTGESNKRENSQSSGKELKDKKAL